MGQPVSSTGGIGGDGCCDVVAAGDDVIGGSMGDGGGGCNEGDGKDGGRG